MYLEFCHHQNERFIVIILLLCLFCAAKLFKSSICNTILLIFFEGTFKGGCIGYYDLRRASGFTSQRLRATPSPSGP
jgi:hypothetical protein